MILTEISIICFAAAGARQACIKHGLNPWADSQKLCLMGCMQFMLANKAKKIKCTSKLLHTASFQCHRKAKKPNHFTVIWPTRGGKVGAESPALQMRCPGRRNGLDKPRSDDLRGLKRLVDLRNALWYVGPTIGASLPAFALEMSRVKTCRNVMPFTSFTSVQGSSKDLKLS